MQKNRPWYKNHILLLVLAIPTTSLFTGGSMLYFAIKSKNAPVLESYYKEGLSPKKRSQQHASHIKARIEKNILYVEGLDQSQPLNLTLEHPTIAKFDKTFTLNPIQEGLYPLSTNLISEMKSHKWYLKIKPTNPNQQWLLHATFEPVFADSVIYFDWK